MEIQSRLRFHAQIAESSKEVSNYYANFLLWVKGILGAKDKFNQFKKLLIFPLKTNTLIDEIADEYSKVFESQNGYFGVSMSSPELEADFEEYLKNDNAFWEQQVFDAMFKMINSVLIIDLPEEQQNERPEPYQYLLDPSRVLDGVLNRDGGFEYIIFRDGARFACFDDTTIRIYTKTETGNFLLISENFHELGYCPAKFMWDDPIDQNNPAIKQGPIASILSDLDWYLFFETAKKSLDIYAAYPIYWTYKSRCDYKNEEGSPCQGGYTTYKAPAIRNVACPSCESKRLVGPGALIEKPTPLPNQQDIGDPIGVVPAETDSLNYNVSETDRLKTDLIQTATGKNKSKLLNKEALNEEQVRSQFESQTNILQYIAKNFEIIRRWSTETRGRLRYGDDFISCQCTYGTEFYLQSLSELIKDYSEAKESGLPANILMSKLKVIEELQSKNNPGESQIIELRKYLEPYANMSVDECKSYGIDKLDKEGFVFKVAFATFINKFELEHGSLLEFGSKLPLKTKVERIKTVLESYVKQLKITEPKPEPEPIV